MWTELKLKHFKCFQDIGVPLAPLTLLSGVNAAGKSTVIQALALLNQTILDSEWSQVFQLNGDNIRLGTNDDVVNRTTGRKCFGVGVATSDWSCNWEGSSGERQEELSPAINAVEIFDGRMCIVDWERGRDDWEEDAPTKPLYRLIPLSAHSAYPTIAPAIGTALFRIKYLGAERIGPRESYMITPRREFNSVGSQGELTPHYLYAFGEDPANPALVKESDGATILKTVEQWMDSFFPGFGFEIKLVEGTNLVTLRIRTSKSSTLLRSQNVGYGLTHLLPIIVLCAGAQKGDTLLLENPETHLHPAGQSAVGELLAKTASSGVQVLVETHSDHVFNGIRKAVSRSVLPASDAIFNFVTASAPDEKTVHHAVDTLRPDSQGRIARWPNQFFDQFELDLLELP